MILKFKDWIDINKINFSLLSLNPNANYYLQENYHKIYWDNISENYNCIDIIEKNIDKINWSSLSNNKNAIHLLEKNIDKIDFYNLSDLILYLLLDNNSLILMHFFHSHNIDMLVLDLVF